MLSGIINGALAYIQALQITIKYNLWRYFFAPSLIAIVLGVSILGSAWKFSFEIGELLIQFYPFEWGKNTIEGIISVFGGLFILVLGLIIFKNLVIAFASPFMSILSSKVEQHLTGRQEETSIKIGKFIRDLTRGLTIALRNVTLELIFTIFLFVLGLFPLFTPFTTVLIFLVQAYFAGFGNIDFTLERYFNVRDSISFVKQNRGLAIGNGIVFLGLFLTLIGFVFSLPLGTIAATCETLGRLEVKKDY